MIRKSRTARLSDPPPDYMVPMAGQPMSIAGTLTGSISRVVRLRRRYLHDLAALTRSRSYVRVWQRSLKAKEFGQESAEVKKSRAMTQKIWVLAQEADQLAQDYQNQSPHNAQ